MLQNGMVSGSAAQWDAICANRSAYDQANAALDSAIDSLGTSEGFAAAVNEAQGDADFSGEQLAAVMFAIDGPARWKALRTLATVLLKAAVRIELYEDGSLKPGYDISVEQVMDRASKVRIDAIAAFLAGRFGKSAELAS